MKILIKTLIIITILSCLCNYVQAQETKTHSKIISFTPQYMIKRGLMMNIDTKLNNNKWFQISPQIYLANNENYNGGDNYNELIGFGIDFHRKIIVNNIPKMLTFKGISELGIYLSYGPSYNFFYLNYFDDDEYNSAQYHTNIHKLGGDVMIGYQFFIKKILSIDIYTGLGIRYSFIESEGEQESLFSDSYIGFGYTGNLMLLGIRFGLSL